MIYTITFNPAIDYIMHTNKLKTDYINRSENESIYFGGKGINISLVLSELGIDSTALGFIAGFTGEAIEKGLKESGIKTDFVHLNHGFSRINVKIKSSEEMEINGCGPDIPDNKIDELFQKLEKVQDGDTIILAGSIPKSLPVDIYEKILNKLKYKKIRAVVDAEKDLLLKTLKYRPFLIKPNNFELAEIFSTNIEFTEDIVEYARRLKYMGAMNVLISMAGDGAFLIDEHDNIHFCDSCSGIIKNSVGAGDSMIAGFIAGCEQNDYNYALKLGTASGGATAFSDGLAKKDDIYNLLKQLIE